MTRVCWQQRRFASQEINPIVFRLQFNSYEKSLAKRVPRKTHQAAIPLTATSTADATAQRFGWRYHLDRYPLRTWFHHCYTPAIPSAFSSQSESRLTGDGDAATHMKSWHPLPSALFRDYDDLHATHHLTAPFTLQFTRLRAYLDGYFHGRALLAQPLLLRTVAGCFVRLMVYNPSRHAYDYPSLERCLERVFGQCQSAGTSGRSNDQPGRVKCRLDVVELASPILSADILAQYVGKLLEQNVPANSIFDRIGDLLTPNLPRRAPFPCGGLDSQEWLTPSSQSCSTLHNSYTGLPVIGVRLRIKGRPRGEEMAVKHDVQHYSCPKQEQEALMDYGKWSGKLRSGVVGVKAWVHFQRPHRQDETGIAMQEPGLPTDSAPSSNMFSQPDNDNYESDDPAETSSATSSTQADARSLALHMLGLDRDYDPELLAKEWRAAQSSSPGLWNVQCAGQDPSVQALVNKLQELHTPDDASRSRFVW